MFWLAGEFGAQGLVLGGNTNRAGVEVAFAHHNATHGYQCHGGKGIFLGAEQRRDDDIATGAQLTIGLHDNTAAQVVENQRLLSFCQTDFPGDAGMLDRRAW